MSADLITIVIVPDAFQPELNRKHQVEYRPEASVKNYLSELIALDGVTLSGAIDGVIIDDILSEIPAPGSIVSVSAEHEAGAIAAWLATVITGTELAAGASIFSAGIGYAITYGVGYIAASYLITVGMSMLVSALGGQQPSKSSPDGSSSSPTYSFGQLRQTSTEGMPIPIVYGTVRMSGQVIDSYTTVENDGKEYLHYLLAVNDGPVDSIADILINGQPAAQFAGVTTAVRLGTLDQPPVDNFGEAVQQHAETVLLRYGSGTVRTTDGNLVEKITINLVCPYGLYYSKDDGGIDARSVDVLVEYKADGAFNTWIPYKTQRLSGASTTAIRSQVVIDDLAPARYSIRVSRLSPDSSSFREQTTVELVGFAEHVKQVQSYPGIAYYAITALASDQLSSEPSFSALVSRNTVQVLNPYTDQWVSKRASSPAWASYDLMVGHHKIAAPKMIYDEFLDWSDYCDELVYGDNRFTMGIVLDTASDLWATVQRIAAVGRGRIMRRGAYRYGVFADKPTPVVSHLFTMATIRQDSYTRKFLPLKDRANAAEITYWDPDRNYTSQVATYRSAGWQSSNETDQPVKAQIQAFIPRAQAVREARYAVECNQRLRETVVFEAAWNSFTARVGDLAYFQHMVPDYGAIGGRVKSAGTADGHTTITLDRPVTLQPGMAYAIMVQRSDDTFVERVISAVPVVTTSDTITLTEGYSSNPQPNDQWMLGPASTYKRAYRIIQTRRTNRLFATITLLDYDGEIYDNADAYQGVAGYYSSPESQMAINAQAKERLTYGGGGDYQSVIDVTWNGATTVNGSTWSVYLTDVTHDYAFRPSDGMAWASVDGTTFAGSGYETTTMHLGDTAGTSWTIPAEKLILGHRYRIAISPSGKGSADTGTNTVDILIQGKLAPPADISDLTAIWVPSTRSVRIIWPEIGDIDAAGYEIRQGSSWDSASVIARPGLVGFHVQPIPAIMSGQTVTYLVKSVDTSGIYSEHAASATVTIDTITGDFAATAVLYTWSISTPENPNGTSTYDWGTGSQGDYVGDVWSTSIPSNPGTPGLQLWQATKPIIGFIGDTTATVVWDSGFSVSSITRNGSSGPQVATPTVYQWAATLPEGTTGTGTYTWSTGEFDAAPTGWSLTPGDTPSAGFTLWAARVQIIDSAENETTGFNWATASISAVGYAGSNGSGASARVMYSRIPGNPSPVAGTITVSGDGRPTQGQSKTKWGLDYAWYSGDPDTSSTASLYTSDGIYDPATGNAVWATPYLASLKVGTLSAITANLGTVNAGILESSGYSTGGAGTYFDLNNGVLEVFDTNGTLRVKIGKLS